MWNEIDFGLGILHLDVLRARIRRRRRVIRAVAVLFVLGSALATFRPLLQGQGTLELRNRPPDVTLMLDDRPFSGATATALSGSHRLRVRRADTYPIALDVTMTRDQTTTLELPSLRPRPAVQAIPLPAPGAAWSIASPDPAGGWRLTATSVDIPPTPQASFRGVDTTLPAKTVLHLDTFGLARLSALEAYGAADEQITPAGRFWTAWEPLQGDFRTDRGTITINTPTTSMVMTTTALVTGLWWAPGGRQLLIAVQRGIGQDLFLWTTGSSMIALESPIVTIPGHIASVRWTPDGHAAVLLSTRPDVSHPAGSEPMPTTPTWDATLLLPGARPQETRALRLASPPSAPIGLIPMDWRPDALYWTAETPEGLVLERIPLATALPRRVGILPIGTIALRVLDDDQVRVLVRDVAGVVTMRTWPAGDVLFTLDDVPSAPPIGGLWSGDTLLLASGADLWQLTFAPETIK
jgi:hypothetical protein